MAPQTPYTSDLNGSEPISAMRQTVERIASLATRWTPAQFERSYAPGKWTARQILIHLAQTELALGNRARMALATPNYAAQAFDQNDWMRIEPQLTAADALAALVAANAMNRALFASLAPPTRGTPFSHPEYGALTVDWLIHQIAGHLIHHEKQIEQIAAQ